MVGSKIEEIKEVNEKHNEVLEELENLRETCFVNIEGNLTEGELIRENISAENEISETLGNERKSLASKKNSNIRSVYSNKQNPNAIARSRGSRNSQVKGDSMSRSKMSRASRASRVS